MILRTLLIAAWILQPMNGYALVAADTELLPMGLKTLAALTVVVGVMLLVYALLKKSGRWLKTGQDSAIKLLEVRYLAPKKALYLIEVKETTLLLSATSERMETLAQWPVNIDHSSDGEIKSFATDLEQQVSSRADDVHDIAETGGV